MIIKSRTKLPILVSDRIEKFPVLPLKTGILFPGSILTIQVGLESNLALINHCIKRNRKFVASYSPDHGDDHLTPVIQQIGVLAEIVDCRKGPANSQVVTIQGLKRAVIEKEIEQLPFVTARISWLEDPDKVPRNLKELITEVELTVKGIIKYDSTYSKEQLHVIEMNKTVPGLLADSVAAFFKFPLKAKQSILETINIKNRYEKLLLQLKFELDRVGTIQKIDQKTRQSLIDEQHDEYLRMQLREVRRELGDDFYEEKETENYKREIKANKDLPKEVVERATIEADRLSQLSTASAEYGVTKNYLDWLITLPWGKSSGVDYQISEVERILSREYYGPTNIKEQILQRLSVRKLLGGTAEGPTLCLVGAHGTGKASLAKAIAKSLGKEFIRISVGGIADVSEIKGTSRTFLGAMPGKIIRTLRDFGSADPVILIEDIDYFNIDNDSSVNTALLDVIDIRKNGRFLDNYLGVNFDLSQVFFICSVRSFEEIPEQFLDRLELLEFPGYIEKEKMVITKRYIIPSMLKKHGISKSEVKFVDKALSNIINYYTMEAGLSAFSQQIEKIFRKIALQKVERKKSSWKITEKNLESYLGSPIYIPEKASVDSEIGTATGLAWTGSGGDLMFIEGLKMKGEGQVFSTGSLGEVMKESIQAAHSYVRSKADMLGIDFNDFNDFDIHIHFPSGSIPKDGPSAGVTVCLVIASCMSERPIRNDIAMTGEVTLRGRVLPVGGIKEKISAAFRAGIFHVIIPKENEKDLKDLPKEIIRKSKFTFIDRVDKLFEICLKDFIPSSFTLQKMFVEELEKSKKIKKPAKTKKKTITKAARSRKKK